MVLGLVSLGGMVIFGKVGQNLCNLTPEETFHKDAGEQGVETCE